MFSEIPLKYPVNLRKKQSIIDSFILTKTMPIGSVCNNNLFDNNWRSPYKLRSPTEGSSRKEDG